MEKKNPYVTTIGFKKEDPEHVYVAELLNSMGRGKAQYIVKAVLNYQNMLTSGGGIGVSGAPMASFDYTQIKQMVYQVLKELKENGEEPLLVPDVSADKKHQEPEEQEDSLLSGLDEDAMSGILASIAAFQAQ